MSLIDISSRVQLLTGANGTLTNLDSKIATLEQAQVMWQGNLNTSWVVVTFILVVLMQGGLTMLEAGSARRKNVAGHIFKNLSATAIGALMFWFCGWALGFGVNNNESVNGFIGNSDLLLVTDRSFDLPLYARYSFQFSLMMVSLFLVLGATTERLTLTGTYVFSFFYSAFIYPVVAHWVWSNSGWISSKNTTTNFVGANGLLDFAGATVVHLTGGVSALAVAWVIGERKGRFVSNDVSDFVEGNSSLLKYIGTFLVWIGWYGFALGGGEITFDKSGHLAKVGINITLSAATSALLLLIVSRGNLTRVASGALAGLVAISGACGFVEPWAAAIIGVFAGVAFLVGVAVTNGLAVDDATNAYAISGSAGMWGTLAVGVFATQQNTIAAIGHDTPRFGFLYGGGGQQFGVQLLGLIVISIWAFFWSAVIAFVLKAIGFLRVSDETEELAIDLGARPEAHTASYLGLAQEATVETREEVTTA